MVCHRGFVPANMPPVCCYEDVDAHAGVIVWASTWTQAFLALPSYTFRQRCTFSIIKLIFVAKSNTLSSFASRSFGRYGAFRWKRRRSLPRFWAWYFRFAVNVYYNRAIIFKTAVLGNFHLWWPLWGAYPGRFWWKCASFPLSVVHRNHRANKNWNRKPLKNQHFGSVGANCCVLAFLYFCEPPRGGTGFSN